MEQLTNKIRAEALLITNGVSEKINANEQFSKFICQSLTRHLNGDWGDLCEEDKQLNENALRYGNDRLFSRYVYNGETNIYIITEWDRSATTILLSDEY